MKGKNLYNELLNSNANIIGISGTVIIKILSIIKPISGTVAGNNKIKIFNMLNLII
jgi:hypothetical protein